MEVNYLTQKLQRLINRAEIVPFFEAGLKVKMEAELILLNGKIQRPDRIIFYPEKAVVLDYKTGVELEKHKTQLHNYASTLSQMGYLEVEKYLLYTESEKLVRA
jgi:CRISPR/Cas system-associated exonuclease Cas4 (RecB family)